MDRPDRPQAFCLGCKKQPSELEEYVGMGEAEGMTADDYCWEEEGTLNLENGHFLCTSCYVKAGMPSSSRGWVAP
jgi:hypothetical protein